MIQFNSFDLFLKPTSKPKAHAPENNIKKKYSKDQWKQYESIKEYVKTHKVLQSTLLLHNPNEFVS